MVYYKKIKMILLENISWKRYNNLCESPMDLGSERRETLPTRLIIIIRSQRTIPRWYTSGWRPCSKTCGKGVQLRKIACRRKINQDQYETVEDSSCAKKKPAGILQQECNKVACPAEWKHLSWSEVNKRNY